jgi:prophage regulatory protein
MQDRGQDRRLRLAEVKQRVGLSRSEIYRRIQRKEFPAQVRESYRVSFWWESDVQEWLRNSAGAGA